MPRKSIDIRLTDYPIKQKRGIYALFLPSGEDGFGQSPKMGQGTSSLWGLGQRPKALNKFVLEGNSYVWCLCLLACFKYLF